MAETAPIDPQSELEAHEAFGSNYLDSPHADQAYEAALSVVKTSDSAEETQDAEAVLMQACEFQAKIRLKQGEDDSGKYEEALAWADKAIEGPNINQAAFLHSHRGSILARLGRYDEASTAFQTAKTFATSGDGNENGDILVLEHRLFADKESPYFDPYKAGRTLDLAREEFTKAENPRMVKYVERYKLSLLARTKQFGKLAVHSARVAGSLAEDRRELAKRARKLS